VIVTEFCAGPTAVGANWIVIEREVFGPTVKPPPPEPTVNGAPAERTAAVIETVPAFLILSVRVLGTAPILIFPNEIVLGCQLSFAPGCGEGVAVGVRVADAVGEALGVADGVGVLVTVALGDGEDEGVCD
jgi:hypothetical protein